MKLIKELSTNKEFLDIRILVIATVLGSLLYLIITQNRYQFSLQLYFVQNFLVPLICASLFLRHSKPLSSFEDFRTGIKIGVIVGTITAISSAITTDISYYFLGGREEMARILGTHFLPVTVGSFLLSQVAQISLIIIMVIISAIAGLIGTGLEKLSDYFGTRREHK